MTDAGIIDDYLKIIYIDPLVEDAVIDYNNNQHRIDVIEGDELMHPYIQKLDEEIFSDPPILIPTGVDQWDEEHLGDMFTQLVDESRTLSWSVVKFYKTEPFWRVFSPIDLISWEFDAKKNVVGGKFQVNTLTGSGNEICIFGYQQCYLLKWKEGDGKENFAFPDISPALWTAATIARQIRNQLDIMCAKPEFPWVKYGEAITPAQRTAVMNAIDNSSITNGIGATENAVADIKFISHTVFTELGAALDKRAMRFAGLTRLPYAFYNGERESSGLGEKGELIVEMKIDKRKQHIFNKVKPIIKQLYLERYHITLTDIEMDMNEVEENETQPITEEIPNEQIIETKD